jgi:hypothetical protein
MTFEMKGNQLNLDGRRIGWITRTLTGTRVFRSPRNRKQHYFRIFEGWGLSRDVYFFLKREGFEEIQLLISQQETLISQLSDWEPQPEGHGILYQHPNFEPQIILPERYMKRHLLTLGQMLENPNSKL